MITRRQLLKGSAALLAGGAVSTAFRPASAQERVAAATQPPLPASAGQRYTPVVTLNGRSLSYKMDGDVKVFHLIAEACKREFAPGMIVNCWGYNGSTPGPTIECVEGDKVRILVTNRLGEHTSIHWHGIFLPNGMDGVAGLTQPAIQPGETFVYEFTLRQNGTFMYHPHGDEMVQLAMGMYGLFIVHPREPEPHVDRDYAFVLHNFAVHAGTATPDASVMTDFNMWTFNSRVFPGIDPMVARTGERVRIRIANLSMHEHPIHIHGTAFELTGTDAGWVPPSARFHETTLLVPVGGIRVGECTFEIPGDWAIHCHKSHHTMNAMGHEVPNMLGVDQSGVEEKIQQLVPEYMAMGQHGMAEHAAHTAMGHMPLPENTLPMMMGEGPFGLLEMGGMFTTIKVRDDLVAGDYRDPGWYQHPPGTVAWKASEEELKRMLG
jgi:FtsP/CotA-like multicopper oxidase with cupredoxin domain